MLKKANLIHKIATFLGCFLPQCCLGQRKFGLICKLVLCKNFFCYFLVHPYFRQFPKVLTWTYQRQYQSYPITSIKPVLTLVSQDLNRHILTILLVWVLSLVMKIPSSDLSWQAFFPFLLTIIELNNFFYFINKPLISQSCWCEVHISYH